MTLTEPYIHLTQASPQWITHHTWSIQWWLKSWAKDSWVFQKCHARIIIKKTYTTHHNLSKQSVIAPAPAHASAQKHQKNKKKSEHHQVQELQRETAAQWEWRREAVFCSQTAPALLRGDGRLYSHLAHTHTPTHTPIHTHTRRRRFASCRRAHDKKPVTRCTCDGGQPRRVLLHRLIRGRLALLGVSDRALNEDIAAMVKDKAENRTLQYQQTLVSFGWGHRWCFPSCVGRVGVSRGCLFGRRMETQLLVAQLCPVWEQEEQVQPFSEYSCIKNQNK